MKNAILIKKQIEVFKELEESAKLIEPIIATGKKITKRELDKANKLLLEKLGSLKNSNISRVYVYILKGYTNTLKLLAQDRSLREGDYTFYVSDYEKTIFLDDNCSISSDSYKSYLKTIKNKSELQIEKDIEKFKKIEKTIESLRDKQREIEYSYLIKERI